MCGDRWAVWSRGGVEVGSFEPMRETVDYLFNQRVARWNALYSLSEATTSFCFSLDSGRKTDIFLHPFIFPSISPWLCISPAHLHSPCVTCFSLLSCPFNGLHWLVKVTYACRAVCVTCLCVYETAKKHVCVCHSICSYINSHFPPEQTHFPNTHLTHESQQGHTHTKLDWLQQTKKLL